MSEVPHETPNWPQQEDGQYTLFETPTSHHEIPDMTYEQKISLLRALRNAEAESRRSQAQWAQSQPRGGVILDEEDETLLRGIA